MSVSVIGVQTSITVKRDLVDTHLCEAWTSISQIAPEHHPRCLVHLKRGDRLSVPLLVPRAGSLFLGVLWVSLSFWEVHPVHPAWRQRDRLSFCSVNGMRVTASSPLGGPYWSPETGHDPQHTGCFQGKQNLAPLRTFSVSLQGSKILSSASSLDVWLSSPPLLLQATKQAHYCRSCFHSPGSFLVLTSREAVCLRHAPIRAFGHFCCPLTFLSQPQWYKLNCLFLLLLPLRGEEYSWSLGFHNGLASFFSPRRGQSGGWVQPHHVEHLLFLPVAMATELLAGLALKGSRWYPAPGPSSERTGKREGERGTILILMRHGQCFQMVSFCHKEAIGHLHLSDLTTVLQ